MAWAHGQSGLIGAWLIGAALGPMLGLGSIVRPWADCGLIVRPWLGLGSGMAHGAWQTGLALGNLTIKRTIVRKPRHSDHSCQI